MNEKIQTAHQVGEVTFSNTINHPPPQAASWRFPSDMPFLEALSTCETFKCITDAHKQPMDGIKYNFPHFMIAGWSKSATTSLYQ